jgi:hypothetical protein
MRGRGDDEMSHDDTECTQSERSPEFLLIELINRTYKGGHHSYEDYLATLKTAAQVARYRRALEQTKAITAAPERRRRKKKGEVVLMLETTAATGSPEKPRRRRKKLG